MRLVFALLIFSMGGLSAHVVEQFYAEIIPDEESWKMELLFDVGYATPEGRGDATVAAPTYDWLVARTSEELENFVIGSEVYLRECLGFFRGGEALEVDYHFGDFDRDPPEFYRDVVDGAYFRVTISPRENSGAHEVRCRVFEGERPNFVFARSQSENEGDLKYLTARPGEEVLIAEGGENSGWFVFKQGFAHVIPLGLDHVLFILALFLARRNWKFLLQQSVVFTIAHSFTLGIAAAGLISVPAYWVEALIALSILFLAAENLWFSQSKGRRFSLILLFGLLHGLGFAAVLLKFLGSEEQFLIHLLLMNLGVEVAQIVILAVAWALTLKWNKSRSYKTFTIGANVALIAVAAWWFFQRI